MGGQGPLGGQAYSRVEINGFLSDPFCIRTGIQVNVKSFRLNYFCTQLESEIDYARAFHNIFFTGMQVAVGCLRLARS